MILPDNYNILLLVLVLGMLCWGAWANTLKALGENGRFELYCVDFAIGAVVAAAIIALTWGSLGFDGFSFMDDLRLAGKRQEVFALAAGAVFNLGNMLLLGALSVLGMAIAFPVGMGVALIVGLLWTLALNPGEGVGTVLSSVGLLVVAGAVLAAILAWRMNAAERLRVAEAAAAGSPKGRSRKKRVGVKGIVLSLWGGLMLGSFAPLVQMARAGENGLGPYSAGFIFTLGIFFSTFVFDLFFMNLPVKGEVLEPSEYFRVPAPRHAMGTVGGILWYVGMIATLLGGRVEGAAKVQPSIGYALTQGGIVIAALCGILLWKEFADSSGRVKTYLGMMLALLVIGVSLISASSPATPY